MVDMEVMVIERAIFALARYAMTFDATPLGEQPISTIPAAISGRKMAHFGQNKTNDGHNGQLGAHPDHHSLRGFKNQGEILDAHGRTHPKHDDLDKRNDQSRKLVSPDLQKQVRII